MKYFSVKNVTGGGEDGLRQYAPWPLSLNPLHVDGMGLRRVECYNSGNCRLFFANQKGDTTMERPRKTEPSQFLSGWKEIANYLGKGVRTAQRYERQMGLPVRRPAGKLSGSVVAVPAELDGWVKASPIREVFRLRQDQVLPNAIRDGLKELGRLREQMSTLRSEMRESLRRFQSSIYQLHGGTSGQASTERPVSSLLLWEEQNLLGSNQRTAVPKYPKAS